MPSVVGRLRVQGSCFTPFSNAGVRKFQRTSSTCSHIPLHHETHSTQPRQNPVHQLRAAPLPAPPACPSGSISSSPGTCKVSSAANPRGTRRSDTTVIRTRFIGLDSLAPFTESYIAQSSHSLAFLVLIDSMRSRRSSSARQSRPPLRPSPSTPLQCLPTPLNVRWWQVIGVQEASTDFSDQFVDQLHVSTYPTAFRALGQSIVHTLQHLCDTRGKKIIHHRDFIISTGLWRYQSSKTIVIPLFHTLRSQCFSLRWSRRKPVHEAQSNGLQEAAGRRNIGSITSSRHVSEEQVQHLIDDNLRLGHRTPVPPRPRKRSNFFHLHV